jgi:RNA polymerase sigma-70 factor (ECF subfamily)
MDASPSPAILAHPTPEVVYAVACAYLPDALRLLRVPPGDADDILHDIVLAAYSGLDRYDPELFHDGRNDPMSALKAWLAGIAWRQTTKYRDRAHRRHELPSGDGANLPMDPADDTPSSEQMVAIEQRRRIVDRVLQGLHPERADVLIMHDLLGMTVPAIAAELGVNANTVASRISRGRRDFQAAARRLDRDRRSLLEEGMSLLPLGLGSELLARLRRLGASLEHVGFTLGLAAGTFAVLVLGMGLGAGLVSRAGPAAAMPPPIVAVSEPAVSASAPSAGASPPAISVAALPVVTQPAAARAPAKVARGSALAEELEWIEAARRALAEGAIERGLASLSAHERQFPDGQLAEHRERLMRRARAALLLRRAGAASPH